MNNRKKIRKRIFGRKFAEKFSFIYSYAGTYKKSVDGGFFLTKFFRRFFLNYDRASFEYFIVYFLANILFMRFSFEYSF